MNKNTLTYEDFFKKYGTHEEHAKQVKTYSENILDALNESGITNFSPREKEYLKIAALLHDTGYYVEKKSHHKHTLDLILKNGIAGFDETETKIIANTARYHRASLPSEEKHKHFAELSEEHKELVKKLGSILRIADGMDKPEKNLILRIKACQTPKSVDFYLKTIGFKPKLTMAQEKSDLFEKTFQKKVNFILL